MYPPPQSPTTTTPAQAPESPSLTQYDVHLFPVIRLKISGIAASSPQAAIEIAQNQMPVGELDSLLRPLDAEYAEEFSHYLVDVVGDEEFLQSEFFSSTQEVCLAPLLRLVQWYDTGRNEGLLRGLIDEVRELLRYTV